MVDAGAVSQLEIKRTGSMNTIDELKVSLKGNNDGTQKKNAELLKIKLGNKNSRITLIVVYWCTFTMHRVFVQVSLAKHKLVVAVAVRSAGDCSPRYVC